MLTLKHHETDDYGPYLHSQALHYDHVMKRMIVHEGLCTHVCGSIMINQYICICRGIIRHFLFF
eukprot:c29181_g1_i1 orf=39-230(-)